MPIPNRPPPVLTMLDSHQISDREFAQFRTLMHEVAGIDLAPSKKSLLCGRLSKRLRSRQLTSFGKYFDLISKGDDPVERETCINLLTTNETYFFRESKHFDFLRRQLLPARAGGPPFRAWSAACSSGEEPYSIAMVTADVLGLGAAWEVYGSDLNTAVLQKAALGRYPMERAGNIPEALLRAYCLKGIGAQAGTFAIGESIRKRASFGQVNLNAELPRLAPFDVIFLRNVMIYFDAPTKRLVISRLVAKLKPGGYLIVGHSESLNGVSDALRLEAPTIYRVR